MLEGLLRPPPGGERGGTRRGGADGGARPGRSIEKDGKSISLKLPKNSEAGLINNQRDSLGFRVSWSWSSSWSPLLPPGHTVPGAGAWTEG